tara:strand:- start:2169 stop:2720 length:552 start_codon:yes stop_codon:yes gene_type:complete
VNINKKKIAIDALNILKIKGWDKVTIKEIKKKSKIKSFDKIINSKQDILTLINQYFDFVLSLNSKNIEKSNNKDMIFEVLMMRFDILQKHRKGIISIFNSFKKKPNQVIFLLPDILSSVEIMIEYTNLSSKKIIDKIMIKGVFIIYLSSFLVWMKDETSSLEKTMTALDNNLEKATSIIKFLT